MLYDIVKETPDLYIFLVVRYKSLSWPDQVKVKCISWKTVHWPSLTAIFPPRSTAASVIVINSYQKSELLFYGDDL